MILHKELIEKIVFYKSRIAVIFIISLICIIGIIKAINEVENPVSQDYEQKLEDQLKDKPIEYFKKQLATSPEFYENSLNLKVVSNCLLELVLESNESETINENEIKAFILLLLSKTQSEINYGDLYYILSIIEYFEGDLNESIKFVQLSAKEHSIHQDQKGFQRAKIDEGIYLCIQGKYFESNVIYFELLQNKTSSTHNLGQMNLNISMNFHNSTNYAEAIQYANRALEYSSDKMKTKVYFQLCISHLEINNVNKALEYVRLIEKNKKNRSKSDQASLLELKALIKDKNNDAIGALKDIEQSISISNNIGDDYLVVIKLFEKAVLLEKLNRLSESNEILNKTLILSKKQGNDKILQDCYEKLYYLNKKLNNQDLAFEYLEKHIIISDSLYPLEMGKKLLNLDGKYRSELREDQINLLEQNNLSLVQDAKNKDLIIEKTSSFIIFLSLLILLLLIIFSGIIYIVVLTKRKAKIKIDLLTKERKIGELKYILDGQEYERSRISKELHDGIGNDLLALLFSEKADLKEGINQIYHEITDISNVLASPNFKAEHSISQMTQQMINQLFSETHTVHYEWFPEGKHLTFNRSNQLSLFRIIQELFLNIIKHSKATQVEITFYLDENQLMLVVTDNGIGFDFKKKKKGIGLSNINERVALLNAQIRIKSSQETGTTTIIEIPLNGNILDS